MPRIKTLPGTLFLPFEGAEDGDKIQVRKSASKTQKTKKKEKELFLPFKSTDPTQKFLYYTILHLRAGNKISEERFLKFKRLIFGRMGKGFDRNIREDIFSEFIVRVLTTESSFEVFNTNKLIRLRLTNSITAVIGRAFNRYEFPSDFEFLPS